MKKKTLFYIISVILFIVLFYERSIGINVSILAIFLLFASFRIQGKIQITKDLLIAFGSGILSSFSFAYYGDFTSFLVLFLALSWMSMQMFDPTQKFIKLFILTPLNYLMTYSNIGDTKSNVYKSVYKQILKRIIAYVIIPITITFIFSIVYILSSEKASTFLSNLNFTLNFNLGSFLFVTVLSLLLMYVFWFFKISNNWNVVTKQLPDNYIKDTFKKLSIPDMVRKSAEITFIMLNIALFFTICLYGFENFYSIEKSTNYSADVHKRVYAVIGSIIMAIGLILYFFQDAFNFDVFNIKIKRLTYLWIGLNAILVVIAFAKNIEYVDKLGLTEKRLGVFLFLTLSLIGLFLTFRKVSLRKTNWFLVNRMAKLTYFSFLLIAVFNWSWIITQYNINAGLAIESNWAPYHQSLDYNDLLLYDYYDSKGQDFEKYNILRSYSNKKLNLDGDLYSIYVKNELAKRRTQ